MFKTKKKLFQLGKNGYYTGASLELTRRCNARCDYCYVVDNESVDLPTDKIFTILKKLSDEGILFLSLTGGEPFLRHDMLDILGYIVKLNFWHTFILSNGTLITDEHVRFLIEHKQFFPFIQFSFFSHKPEVHDRYLGVPGSLYRMLKAAEELKKAGISIRLALSILDINVDELSDTFRFCESNGFPVQIALHKLHSLQGKIHKNQNMDRIRRSSSEVVIDRFLSESSLFKNGDHDTFPCGKNTNPDGKCGSLFTAFSIDYDGSIRPCTSFRKMTFGNILEMDSWQEELQANEILNKIKRKTRSEVSKCSNCEAASFCAVCPGLIHTSDDSGNNPSDLLCNFALTLKKKYEKKFS